MPKYVRTAHVFEKKWRSEDVRLQEEATFSSLLLPEKILLGLENAGYKTPSPIQLESIPVGLFGRDLLVQAKSGTGKTLVFTVIALETLTKIKYPQVLIMAPTREIALQICDVVRAVGSSFKHLACNCFIGGVSVDADIERVHGCQIIVGTPGRLKHLIALGILPTNSIRLLVLDEADVLLEKSFKNDLDYIFVSLPKEKQVIATSATYPKELRSLTRQYFRRVFLARINHNELTLLGMVHYIQVLELPKMSLLAYKAKLAALGKVVTSVQFTQCLVFCNLISRVESLCYDIRNWGFTSTFISSAKEQGDRIRAIENLKRFRCKILVTSDITSRGIDAENVDLVVNFDKPTSTEVYFHRCGRAGRYGAKGVAITFLEKDQVLEFNQMKVQHNLKAYNLPDPIPRNLINVRPTECDLSNEESEGLSDDLSADELTKESNDQIDQANGKTKGKNCVDPLKLCNGKTPHNLNETADLKEPTSQSQNGHCDLDNSIKNADLLQEKSKCATGESMKQDLMTESVRSENNNGIEQGGVESNDDVERGNVLSLTKETNSFLDYLRSGPKTGESSSGSASNLNIVSNNKAENIISEEPQSEASISDANDVSFQNGDQHSSESQSFNNNVLDDVLDLENSKQDVNKESKNDEKSVTDSDSCMYLTEAKNDESVDEPTQTNALPLKEVAVECLNETKIKFVPNKMQLSIGKFLSEHVDKSNVGSLKSSESIEIDQFSSTKNCSFSKTETDVAASLKDVRDDLTDFYSKVYNAYRCENISDTDFVSTKELSIQQNKEEIKNIVNATIIPNNAQGSNSDLRKSDNPETVHDTKGIMRNVAKGTVIPGNSPGSNSDPRKSDDSETVHDKKGQCSSDLKSCDIKKDSLHSVAVSNAHISSKKNATPEVFERHVLKEFSADDFSTSSDDSSCDNSYLALKKFDKINTSRKKGSGTKLKVSDEKEKSKNNKKFSENAGKGHHHSSPLNAIKANHSDSSDDTSCDNSYLALKKLDNITTSRKAGSGTKLQASGKNEKEKSKKNKKFSENAGKGHRTPPFNSRKPNHSECSSLSSDEEDVEIKIQEINGVKNKVFNKKQSYKQASKVNCQAKNKPKNKRTAKPPDAIKISEEYNTTLHATSEASVNAHSSQNCNSSASNLKESSSTYRHFPQESTSANYENNPLLSHHSDYTNIPSVHQPCEYSMNYGNFSHMDRNHQPTAENYGNVNQPYQCHTSGRCDCGNVINHHLGYRLPNHYHSHPTCGYAPNCCIHGPVNLSHTCHENHHQYGSACCNSYGPMWYQLYQKQWQFIHSSLF